MRPYEVAERKLRLELKKLGFEEGQSLEEAVGEMLRLGELLVEIVEDETRAKPIAYPLLCTTPILLLSEPKN